MIDTQSARTMRRNDAADNASITTVNNTEPNNSKRRERMAILFPLAPSSFFVCPLLRCSCGLRGLRDAIFGLRPFGGDSGTLRARMLGVLALPNMFTAGAVHGISGPLLG